MRKVNCEACGASYEVDPRRVPPNGMKMRCPACGASFHVAGEASAAQPAKGGFDLDLDLPAPKAKGAAPPKPAAAKPHDQDLDVSDLPAIKPAAKPGARAAIASPLDDLTDLPTAKPSQDPALRKTAPAGLHAVGPAARAAAPAKGADPSKPSTPLSAELDLPAPKGHAFGREPPSTKTRGLGFDAAPKTGELDLPAPKGGLGASGPGAKGGALGFAPSAKGGDIDLDLPSPKGGGFGADLPAPKGGPGRSPKKPEPIASEPIAPKKNFAKPPVTSSHALPGRQAPPAALGGEGGTLPKDSLSIEPNRPLFSTDAPMGTFGKLDDLGGDDPDLVDLPAPQDLPAVKRPGAGTAKTTLGLGRGASAKGNERPAGGGLPMAEPEKKPLVPASDPLSELDLPAPRDLPAAKKRAPMAATAMGLGAGLPMPPRPTFDAPAAAPLPVQPKALSMPDLSLDLPTPAQPKRPIPDFALDLPPPAQARARSLPDLGLDLPPPKDTIGQHPLDLGDFGGLGSSGKDGDPFDAELDLPPPRPRDPNSLGDLEPIVLPSVGTSNNNARPLATMELAPDDLLPTGGEARGRGKPAGPKKPEAAVDLKGMLELSEPPPGASQKRGSGSAFGELELSLGRESSPGRASIPGRRSIEIAATKPAKIEDAELVDEEEPSDIERRPQRRRERAGKKLPGWVIPVGVVALVGITGTALGLFTEHGYFGVYLVEQMLPAAGDPTQVRAALEQAERQAKSDTYVDLRKALVTLSDARNEAGLNRGLLARSLLHEALYQLRFGDDAQSAQRSAAILARALERGSQSPGLPLARAADALRRGDLNEAKQSMAEVPADDDPYRTLVAGELALRAEHPEQAIKAFTDSVAHGGGARARWGLARALRAAGKLDEAEQAAKATLAESPRHSAAHVLMAERALARGQLDVALGEVHAASGRAAIDGTPARTSRAERATAFALEGTIEEKRDHPREALAAYEAALASNPLAVDVLLGSGRMLMRLGRPQDALSRFDSALNAKPSTTPGPDGHMPLLDAGIGAVQALLALQRPQEALTRSTALLTQFPNEPEVKLWHGHVLEALERFEEAEAAFRETIEKAPTLFAGYVGLSQLLFRRGRPEEGARTLTLATGRVQDSAEVRRMLGHSELQRNHLPEALHQFEAALRFNPRDPGALFGTVVAQRKAGNLGAAEQALDRLEKADPTFPGLALERGQLLENRGEYTAAVTLYRHALEQRPTDTELKLRLGAALVTAGEVDEAEAVLGQVLKERPTSAEAEHYLGRVLFARKETAQAAQRFERAVNFDTLKAEYHMYLAWALLEQGNFGGALSSIEKAIARDPSSGDARWLLGRIQLRTGAVRDALGNFQGALRLKPGRVEALANMGDAYDELRDLPNAIRSYQEALRQAPDHADWWYRLGQLHRDRGSRDEARVTLSEAVLRGDRLRDRPTWLADAHRAYADVLRESKRSAEAIAHYKLFLELAPLGHPDRAEIEAFIYQTRR